MSEFLTTAELAEKLRAPVNTVSYWRARGTGPRGVRVGKRVLYRWSDVEMWLQQLDSRGEDLSVQPCYPVSARTADRPGKRRPAVRRTDQGV